MQNERFPTWLNLKGRDGAHRVYLAIDTDSDKAWQAPGVSKIETDVEVKNMFSVFVCARICLYLLLIGRNESVCLRADADKALQATRVNRIDTYGMCACVRTFVYFGCKRLVCLLYIWLSVCFRPQACTSRM